MTKDKPNKPYLVDVEVGDKLYNFLYGDREYIVVSTSHSKTFPILVKCLIDETRMTLTLNGTELVGEKIPYYLYRPVKVLDPDNLPERPWRLSKPWTPKKGEWIWVKDICDNFWNLRKFRGRYGSFYRCEPCTVWPLAAQYKGELPPGLEEEEGDYEQI